MAMNREVRTLISQQADPDRIKDQALEQGMMTLYQSGKVLVLSGVTTADELLRVAYSIDI